MVNFHAYFSLFLICLISTFLIQWFFKIVGTKSYLPPSPFALPIIGHLHLIAQIPHQAFHKLSLQYGPVFSLFLGYKPCIVVCSPETAKEFLYTNENVYLDRPRNSAAYYLTYGTKDMVCAPYGSHWKFVKKIVISQLLNRPTLDLLSSVRHDEINRFMKLLSQKSNAVKFVDISGEFVKLINNVISRMLMNERCTDKEGEADEVRKIVSEMTEIGGNFNLSDYIWLFKILDLQGLGKKVKRIRARFDVMIDKIIKEHVDARTHTKMEKAKDFLNILLDIAQDRSTEIELTRDNIKALIQNIFIAGTDTSASTLEWGLSELINHPNIMKKARQEIDQVVGRNRLLQESDIPNLPYLQAIVKETLRLHPPVPVIPRESTQDCTVAGYHIPTNCSIFINVWAIGRDPNYWQNPLEFRPERFEEIQLDVRGQHFEMLQFGTGRRMCPGISLALLIVHTTLGAMIQCFEWKAGKDGNLQTVDMKEGFGLTLSKANPLLCIPVSRLDPIPTLA